MTAAYSASTRASVLRDAAVMLVLVGLMAWLSLTLARVPDGVAVVWIGNGIWAGWLLSRPTPLWPGYLSAGFLVEGLVRLLSGDAWGVGLGVAACNVLEVLIVAGNVRRLVPDVGKPRNWLKLGEVATGTTLVACAISGLAAATLISHAGGSPFQPNFVTWYAAHVVGMVIMATFTTVVKREGAGLLELGARRRNFLASMLVLAAVSGGVFYQSAYPLLFLALPPLLWAAFQHRLAGVVVGVVLLAIIATLATMFGHGPLALVGNGDNLERALLLQVFIGTGCLITFPVALAMAERGRLVSRMRQSEARYRLLADYAHDVVMRTRADGQRLYVSPSVRNILGWDPDELLALREGLAHPDDLAIHQQMIAAVLVTGEPGTATYRLRHKDGHYVWIETIARPVPSVDQPGATDIIYAGRDVGIRVAAQQALEASQRELENLARTDSLTGLPNRRQFEERLALALTRQGRNGLPIALMYLDIDHFKQINDRFGHGAGDQALRTLAMRLSRCVRGGDLVARLGGDEFVVLVEDAALPEAGAAIAQKLIAAMDADIVVDGSTLPATISIGIAFARERVDAAALMAAADGALYAAKAAGGHTYRMVMVGAGDAAPGVVQQAT